MAIIRRRGLAAGPAALWLACLMLAVLWASAALASGAPLMSIDDLKDRLGQEDVIIIDVRAPSHFEDSDRMVKGAVRRVPRQVDQWWPEYAGHKKDRTFVLYCA